MTTDKHVDGLLYTCVDPWIDVHVFLLVSIVFATVGLMCLSFVLLTFLCIRFFRDHMSTMTTRTYRLQRILTANLILLTTLPVVLEVFPFATMFIMGYTQHPAFSSVAEVALQVPLVDGIPTCLITLGFVTPYRKYLERVLSTVLNMLLRTKQKKATVAVVSFRLRVTNQNA
uniref:G_PROTEIN_RECEP_F1_2 domain-containing protein n=1 Tax=Steinernema glaseri TaxID=37863 RepID=A0A1I7Y279_9BILA